jgi:hypothetical protein
VARKSKGPTFAELLKQRTWSEAEPRESGEHAVRPGKYNHAGELFDPSGQLLVLQQEDISPQRAQELVRGGARVAHEVCGCGGWAGCQPDWLSSDALSRVRSGSAPSLRGRGVPTWIDVWSSAAGHVIYLHGDVQWGDELG